MHAMDGIGYTATCRPFIYDHAFIYCMLLFPAYTYYI